MKAAAIEQGSWPVKTDAGIALDIMRGFACLHERAAQRRAGIACMIGRELDCYATLEVFRLPSESDASFRARLLEHV
jgi:hypothetical protein